MIRKVGTVDLPVERVRELFSDPESWPHWMAGVRWARVRERSNAWQLVEIEHVQMGWTIRQKLELVTDPKGGIATRQLAGRLRRWEVEWRFGAPPDGRGTTVSMQVDFDLGLASWLFTAGRIARELARFFEQTLEGVERFAGREAAEKERIVDRRTPEAGKPLLQVFETVSGLEVRLGGRAYFLRALDDE